MANEHYELAYCPVNRNASHSVCEILLCQRDVTMRHSTNEIRTEHRRGLYSKVCPAHVHFAEVCTQLNIS